MNTVSLPDERAFRYAAVTPGRRFLGLAATAWPSLGPMHKEL